MADADSGGISADANLDGKTADASLEWKEEGRTHSSCCGTPSAAGRFPSSSLSCPQKLGRRIGAGVTGKLGRSTSVGKSVILRLNRREESAGGVVIVEPPGERCEGVWCKTCNFPFRP